MTDGRNVEGGTPAGAQRLQQGADEGGEEVRIVEMAQPALAVLRHDKGEGVEHGPPAFAVDRHQPLGHDQPPATPVGIRCRRDQAEYPERRKDGPDPARAAHVQCDRLGLQPAGGQAGGVGLVEMQVQDQQGKNEAATVVEQACQQQIAAIGVAEIDCRLPRHPVKIRPGPQPGALLYLARHQCVETGLVVATGWVDG
ncbi:hypothetical protein ACFSKM_13180 [Ancylobacter dichloromethanicus]